VDGVWEPSAEKKLNLEKKLVLSVFMSSFLLSLREVVVVRAGAMEGSRRKTTFAALAGLFATTGNGTE